MGEDSVDPELQTLTERIAAVRAAIDEEMAAREAIARRQAPGDDGPEQALAALRDEVTAARARLSALQSGTAERGRPKVSREGAARRGMYFMGALFALPGAITVGAMLSVRASNPGEALDPIVMLVFAAPLLIGLGCIARGRFANYDAKRDDLDGDFLP